MIKWILRFFLALLVVLGAALVLVLIIGASLPKEHVASRSASLQQPPDVIWKLITGPPDWRPQVRSFKELVPRDGHRTWLETDQHGQTIVYEEVEAVPNRRLVTRIADPKLPFGGTWTFDLAPTAQGSTLTITENGEVHNPIFRFVSRFILGHTATIDTYLKALHGKLG